MHDPFGVGFSLWLAFIRGSHLNISSVAICVVVRQFGGSVGFFCSALWHEVFNCCSWHVHVVHYTYYIQIVV